VMYLGSFCIMWRHFLTSHPANHKFSFEVVEAR
jgi:hypothetical protein